MFEVNQPDKATRRRRGKTDAIDAESAARAVLSGRATAAAKAGDGPVPLRQRHRPAQPPCRGYAENKVWLELALTAADPLAWTQALCFTGDLARAEPATFRYRICAIAAKLTRTARVTTLHLDCDWPWAQHLETAFTRLRTAPWPD